MAELLDFAAASQRRAGDTTNVQCVAYLIVLLWTLLGSFERLGLAAVFADHLPGFARSGSQGHRETEARSGRERRLRDLAPVQTLFKPKVDYYKIDK